MKDYTKSKELIKKTLKYSRNSLLVLLSICAFYWISDAILSRIIVNKSLVNDGYIPVYIQSNGVHTDIVLPIKNDIYDWAKFLPKIDSAYSWLAFGWGNKDFYLNTPEWKDLRPSVGIKAVLGIGDAAMHISVYKKMKVGTRSRLIMIKSEDYQLLIKYLQNSFAKDKNSNIILLGKPDFYGQHEHFYAAKGRYSAVSTCNTWANNALKSCHQKACMWTAFDKGILRCYE